MSDFQPIGYLKTCFKEKFGIPRQPGLVKTAPGLLKLNNDPFLKTALRGLDSFSHLWLIFIFHEHNAKSWKPSIRPPRLGGAKKVGVLASRSPHRPNPIGLSAVKIERINIDADGGPEIQLSGVDCLDGTPVLDIKPYLAYTDSISHASLGWADLAIEKTKVIFSEKALEIISQQDPKTLPHFKELIQEILELDPRPAFQQKKMPPSDPTSEGTEFGFKLYCFDIKWRITQGTFYVYDLVPVSAENMETPPEET